MIREKSTMRTFLVIVIASGLSLPPGVNRLAAKDPVADSGEGSATTIRVAACQAKRRSIDWRLTTASEVLAGVDRNLDELEQIVRKAGEAGCDVLCLPEDTLGLLEWIGMNEEASKVVLPEAVKRMLDRLGRAAAGHGMSLVSCSDVVEADGKTYNTAFFQGRDGKEIGRYHKVCPTWSESGGRARGTEFPVFPTNDLGTVGMLICYDLVFPETARCLALQGADVIFFPTMGGAAVGDGDIGLQALRVRAAENHVYLVFAHRGQGAMIISPRGKIIAQAEGDDGLAIADIDPRGGREGGDSSNHQNDMRARLFRERNSEAFQILTEPNPPVLSKIPIDITREEAGRIFARTLTVGEAEFSQAASLARTGQTKEAITAFEKLRTEYRGTWIDRVAKERLATLHLEQNEQPPQCGAEPAPREQPVPPIGLGAEYPGDQDIAKDPRVIFVENFEQPSLDDLKTHWDTVTNAEIMSLSNDVPAQSGGKRSLLMTHVGGKGTGGQLYRSLKPGYDKLHARFYVKFDRDCAPIHHFGTNIGGYHPATPWPQGGAGERPSGDKTFTVGIEPFGKNWEWDYYAYWCEMRGSPPRGQTWGNSFLGDSKPKVDRGEWTCIEVMVKTNDVDDSNGELALWINGKQVSHLGKGFPKGKWQFDRFHPGEGGEGARWNDNLHGRENVTTPEGGLPFEGFRWRTSEQLNLNYVWVYLYITQAPDGHISRVWYDDIVVATEYIGLLVAEPK
jgi:predicted amidohydrolase